VTVPVCDALRLSRNGGHSAQKNPQKGKKILAKPAKNYAHQRYHNAIKTVPSTFHRLEIRLKPVFKTSMQHSTFEYRHFSSFHTPNPCHA
jgi:hypothetical protein